MTLSYKKSESTTPPPLIDVASSQKVVYIRKNVEKKQRTDELTGETFTYYEYMEAKVPKTEYEKHLLEQVRADVDYLALMTGVDLEETEESE